MWLEKVNIRVILVRRLRKLSAATDRETNERIWSPTTNLRAFDTAGRINVDLNNTDGSVERLA